jgi:hypothetical protein
VAENRNSVQSAIERFEEVINNEPSRTSIRQSTRRLNTQQHNDEDLDGSVIEEISSTNTTSGENPLRITLTMDICSKFLLVVSSKENWHLKTTILEDILDVRHIHHIHVIA